MLSLAMDAIRFQLNQCGLSRGSKSSVLILYNVSDRYMHVLAYMIMNVKTKVLRVEP